MYFIHSLGWNFLLSKQFYTQFEEEKMFPIIEVGVHFVHVLSTIRSKLEETA